MSVRWSHDQEAQLLNRVKEGATLNEVAAELNKNIKNVEMRWRSILENLLASKSVNEVVSLTNQNVSQLSKYVTLPSLKPVEPVVKNAFVSELQAIKDAISALEAKLAAQ